MDMVRMQLFIWHSFFRWRRAWKGGQTNPSTTQSLYLRAENGSFEKESAGGPALSVNLIEWCHEPTSSAAKSDYSLKAKNSYLLFAAPGDEAAIG